MENTPAFWQTQIFNKSQREQLRFRHMDRLFGSTTGDMRCLIAGGTPALHQAVVRRFRGQWTSAAFTPDEAAAIEPMTDGPVILAEDLRFPVAPETYDRIIIVDVFEKVEDDAAMIAECHRILKNSGILLLVAAHRKPFGSLMLLQRLLGLRAVQPGNVRPGYTGRELFDLLKDGFDVQETHTFSRFCLEAGTLLAGLLSGVFLRTEKPHPDNQAALADYYRSVLRAVTLTRLPIWLFSRLDALLFTAKGYLLIARAKKRMWRPRKTPILRDGRSIAEATLGGKIGTALEY